MAANDPTPPAGSAGGDKPLPPLTARTEYIFPTLTPGQSARLAAHGERVSVEEGQLLVDAGERATRFFLVEEGRIEISRPEADGETTVAFLEPGQFTGETNMLSGRPSLVRLHATRRSRLVELDRQHILNLVQTDSELGDVLMRAFILRRVELIAYGIGEVVLGSSNSAETLRLREFLTRNGHPYSYVDVERDADVQ